MIRKLVYLRGNLRCNDGTNVSLYNSSSAWHYPKDDQQFLATGVLSGIITIPFGLLAGGLTAGMPLSLIIPNPNYYCCCFNYFRFMVSAKGHD